MSTRFFTGPYNRAMIRGMLMVGRGRLGPTYKRGVTLRALAGALGVSHEWARTLLKREGVELRARGRMAKLDRSN